MIFSKSHYTRTVFILIANTFAKAKGAAQDFGREFVQFFAAAPVAAARA